MTDTPLSIPDLIAQLSDPDPVVRREAAKALGEAKAVEAIEPLKQVVQNDPVTRVRDVALSALVTIDDPQVIPFLMDTLHDAEIGRTVSWAAADFAPLSIQPLIDILVDEQLDVAVRERALSGLVGCAADSWGSRDAAKTPQLVDSIIDLLIAYLSNEATELREAAAASFRAVRVSRATQPLIPLLCDPFSEVRRAAVDSLGCIGDDAAIDPLIACLKDPDSEVREDAARMLSCFEDTRSVPFLIESLQDTDPEVQDGAVYTLGILKDARALEPIRLIRQQAEGDLLFWCQWALASMGDESAVHPLIAYLPSDSFRLMAANALGDFGNRVAVEPLIEAWKLGVKKSPLRIVGIRRFIVDALKKLDTPRAVEAFTAIVGESDDPEMRKAAQTALDQLHRIESDSPDTRD
ncbi:MAG: HEAT repeat domain-containing protein [Anaerolineae bacterium]|nr:HEAT repeat domain-containing protein [Anaerolineae bacterium]